jgi:ribosome-binding ATPase YchF (GTP1/OBG family)
MLVGIVGKPNVGKSTFFKAITMAEVEIASRPFTTIKPNRGVAYVKFPCPEKDLGKKCNPQNSLCVKGNRFVPFEVLDVAGLVPDAHKGRGLGNQFLDDLRQADAFIHVVDLSGRTDEEGNPTTGYDPLRDVRFLERELDQWFFGIVKKNWSHFVRRVSITRGNFAEEMVENLSGLGIRYDHIVRALLNLGLHQEELAEVEEETLYKLSSELRKVSKPMLIVANKSDLPGAMENLKSLEDYGVVVCSAEVELALREADSKGMIDYIPGEDSFEVIGNVNETQKKALDFMLEFLKKNKGTGVQDAINKAVFGLLGSIVVFPVEDENKLTNNKGHVLPDAFILRHDSTALDLAYAVHTDIGEHFVRAVDCRTKRSVGKDYKLKSGDVIKIHSTK